MSNLFIALVFTLCLAFYTAPGAAAMIATLFRRLRGTLLRQVWQGLSSQIPVIGSAVFSDFSRQFELVSAECHVLDGDFVEFVARPKLNVHPGQKLYAITLEWFPRIITLTAPIDSARLVQDVRLYGHLKTLPEHDKVKLFLFLGPKTQFSQPITSCKNLLVVASDFGLAASLPLLWRLHVDVDIVWIHPEFSSLWTPVYESLLYLEKIARNLADANPRVHVIHLIVEKGQKAFCLPPEILKKIEGWDATSSFMIASDLDNQFQLEGKNGPIKTQKLDCQKPD